MFDLTDAETRVATLIGSGMSLHAIARVLGVSPNTVNTHSPLFWKNRRSTPARSRRRALIGERRTSTKQITL
ncbi:LuxR C-terminal-related transcriptional regulator [Rhizobium changzhiense]|uniref:LuxR C-terminal-related transcriptional regulator n=1 Tax=Rhizobium changzhiense TaxID=2692317 RepID=UPI003CC82CC6